jgi:hypothetical protein
VPQNDGKGAPARLHKRTVAKELRILGAISSPHSASVANSMELKRLGCYR